MVEELLGPCQRNAHVAVHGSAPAGHAFTPARRTPSGASPASGLPQKFQGAVAGNKQPRGSGAVRYRGDRCLLDVEERAQLFGAAGVAQLAQRLGLDLADALAGDVELLADFLEGVV